MEFSFARFDAIMIWSWRDAPKRYRDLSLHGGDEDLVAFVPAVMIGENREGTPYLANHDLDRIIDSVHWDDPQIVWLPDGVLYIWAHA